MFFDILTFDIISTYAATKEILSLCDESMYWKKCKEKECKHSDVPKAQYV